MGLKAGAISPAQQSFTATTCRGPIRSMNCNFPAVEQGGREEGGRREVGGKRQCDTVRRAQRSKRLGGKFLTGGFVEMGGEARPFPYCCRWAHQQRAYLGNQGREIGTAISEPQRESRICNREQVIANRESVIANR